VVMALNEDGRGAGEKKEKQERNLENRKHGEREKWGNRERGAWVLLREESVKKY
jgi:hypothetical protein